MKPLHLGDGVYPLTTYCVKPYPHSAPLTQEQKIFNKHLEQAFGILKGRYRILLKRVDSLITNVSDIIVSCVV